MDFDIPVDPGGIVNGNNKKIAVPLCGKMKFKTI
jgi:hypothetical protein